MNNVTTETDNNFCTPLVDDTIERLGINTQTQTDCACMFNDNCSNLPAILVEEGAKQLSLSSSFRQFLSAIHQLNIS